MFKKPELSRYTLETLDKKQERLHAWKYVMMAFGFFIALLVISSILQFYEIIPNVEDETIQFIMSQTIFIVLVIAALLISFECYMTSQVTKIIYNQIEIIKQLKKE